MTLISTTTLGSSAATITLSSIPQTHTDLMLLFSARETSSTFLIFTLSFNGTATGTNRILEGSGSGRSSFTFGGFAGLSPGSSETANTFSNVQIYIPNYTSSVAKVFSSDSVTENNATAGYSDLVAGTSSVTAAISSLTLNASNTFVANTSVSLYGILKGSGGADSGILGYDFSSSVEGFTAAAATLSVSGGILTQNVTGNDPNITSPTISLLGNSGRYLKITFKRVNSGQSASWDGTVFYSTAGHPFSGSYNKTFAEPTWDGSYKTVTLDMHNLSAGGTDWQNNTITQFRIDFSNAQADGNFLVDSIVISPTA